MKVLSIQILSVVPHNPDIPAVAVAAASDLSSFTFYQRGRYVDPLLPAPLYPAAQGRKELQRRPGSTGRVARPSRVQGRRSGFHMWSLSGGDALDCPAGMGGQGRPAAGPTRSGMRERAGGDVSGRTLAKRAAYWPTVCSRCRPPPGLHPLHTPPCLPWAKADPASPRSKQHPGVYELLLPHGGRTNVCWPASIDPGELVHGTRLFPSERWDRWRHRHGRGVPCPSRLLVSPDARLEQYGDVMSG